MHLYYSDRPISTRNGIHITSHQKFTSWSSREKEPAEGCSLKIPDFFFSRAGMTHYPGSNAGSLVGWVIPQYSETHIAPLHHSCSYSSDNKTNVHCRLYTTLAQTHISTPVSEFREVRFADLFSGKLRWSPSISFFVLISWFTHSEVRRQPDQPIAWTKAVSERWIFTRALSDGFSATSRCEAGAHSSPGLLLFFWMQPKKVWGRCSRG